MVFGLDTISRLWSLTSPPAATKTSSPLRIGLLGASSIAPPAIISAAKSHPDIIVSCVAARDKTRAQAYAKTHGIPHVFSNYQELLDDPGLNAVYNGLPNGLHFEWSMKAVKAGKHVLLEKPSVSNQEEAKTLFEEARKNGVLILEAHHSRFHPAMQEYAYQLHSVLSPQNPLVGVEANLCMPPIVPPGAPGSLDSDIRYTYPLAGGVSMDMGVYPLSAIIYTMRAAGGTEKREAWGSKIEVTSSSLDPFYPKDSKVLEAKTHLDSEGKPQIDNSVNATIMVPTARPQSVECKLESTFATKVKLPLLGIMVPGLKLPKVKATFKDGTEVEYTNFVFPMLFHWITVTRRGRSAEEAGVKDGTKQHFSAYVPSSNSTSDQMKRAAKDGNFQTGVGQPWWSSYRYQLEAFVAGVRALESGTPYDEIPETAPVWVRNEESVIFAGVVDQIYEKGGMKKRTYPSS